MKPEIAIYRGEEVRILCRYEATRDGREWAMIEKLSGGGYKPVWTDELETREEKDDGSGERAAELLE